MRDWIDAAPIAGLWLAWLARYRAQVPALFPFVLPRGAPSGPGSNPPPA